MARSPARISPERMASLRRSFDKLLQAAMPHPLHTGTSHWGDTTRVINGIKWHGLKPELQYGNRNDGIWRKYVITLRTPYEDHLRVFISDPEFIGNDRLCFTVDLRLDLWFEITQQNWKIGVKLFDGDARGIVTVSIKLQCVSTMQFHKQEGSPLPMLSYRMQVTGSQTNYQNLKLEHVAGVGGELAQKLGDWTQDFVKQVKPSWEEKLLEKANRAIVKAADTKEIQIGLSGIERKKK